MMAQMETAEIFVDNSESPLQQNPIKLLELHDSSVKVEAKLNRDSDQTENNQEDMEENKAGDTEKSDSSIYTAKKNIPDGTFQSEESKTGSCNLNSDENDEKSVGNHLKVVSYENIGNKSSAELKSEEIQSPTNYMPKKIINEGLEAISDDNNDINIISDLNSKFKTGSCSPNSDENHKKSVENDLKVVSVDIGKKTSDKENNNADFKAKKNIFDSSDSEYSEELKTADLKARKNILHDSSESEDSGKLTKNMAMKNLFDSSSDSEGSQQVEKSKENTLEVPEVPENGKTTSKKKKFSAKKKPKTLKDVEALKDELTLIHSESQRFVRESSIHLPYHKPRLTTLSEFMKSVEKVNFLSPLRPNLNRVHSLNVTPSTGEDYLFLKAQMENRKSIDVSELPSLDEIISNPVTESKKHETDIPQIDSVSRLNSEIPDLIPRLSDTFEIILESPKKHGVQNLLNRFTKHIIEKKNTHLQEVKMHLVSKDYNNGKDTLVSKELTIQVQPLNTDRDLNNKTKLTSLKEKLMVGISQAKYKSREQKLLQAEMDNENGFEDYLDEVDKEDYVDSELEELEENNEDDSVQDKSEDELADNESEDELADNESEDELADDESEDDKVRNPFLDDSAVEDDASVKNFKCTDLSDNSNHSSLDGSTKDELPDKSIKEHEDKVEILSFQKESEDIFDLCENENSQDFSSSIPPHQPEGGYKYGMNLKTSDSEEETFCKPLHEKYSWLSQPRRFSPDIYEDSLKLQLDTESITDSTLIKDDVGATQNMDELLNLCTGKFTGNSQLNNSDLDSLEDDDDSDIEFNLTKKKIVNQGVSKICFDSDEGNSEIISDEEDLEENEEDKETVNGFFDQEAELSGSDIGSDDENNEEEEEGAPDLLVNEEEFSEDELRNQVGKVHFKALLDEDKRNLRFFQNMYLEDGDLHSDGTGRARKFRWSNVGMDKEEGQVPVESGDEAEKEEKEEVWRVQRFEREKWVKEQEETIKVSPLKTLVSNRFKVLNRSLISKQKESLDPKGLGPRSHFSKDGFLNNPIDKTNESGGKVIKTKNFIFQTSTSPKKTRENNPPKRLLDEGLGSKCKKIKMAKLNVTNTVQAKSIFDLM